MTTFDFARFLNIRMAYAPCFSADGTRLLFVTDVTGVPQVWSLDRPLAWPTQITFGPDRYFYAKSDHKGGRWIVGGDVGGNENLQLALLSADASTMTPLDYDPGVVHSFGGWSPDDRLIAFASNARDRSFFDIYTLAVDEPGATPRLIFGRAGTFLVEAWAPDGTALIVSDFERSLNQNLYLVPQSGDIRLLTPHEGDAIYSSVQWTPDGKSLYLVSDEGRDFAALLRYDLASGEWATVAAPQWDVESCHLSPDGRLLAYTVNMAGYSDLVVLDLASGGEKRPADLPRGLVPSTGAGGLDSAPALNWAPGSKRLAFNFGSPTRNFDVWVWDLESGAAEPWTRSGMAAIPPATFAEPELIEYPSFDGRNVPAFFFLPQGAASGPAPCVVYVHGGPESQTQASFSAVLQYFAHRGYAVLAPNVRGSTGYGREYTHLDDVRLRMDSVRDLAAAVDWLAASGRVDPQRIAVMGGSYGGFMVLAALTAYPDLWAAGVDIVGIANFETFLRNTASWRRPLRESEYGSLEHDLDFLREVSPINHVDKISAPLFVIHGANDPRVPLGEAEQMVARLRQRNHPLEYLVFDDEGHGVVKLKNKLVAYPAIGDFLDKYLR